MITVPVLSPVDYKKLTSDQADIWSPKPITLSDILAIEINKLLIATKFSKKNISFIARPEHCGIVKVMKEEDGRLSQLCPSNPLQEDFSEVIARFQKEWAGLISKVSVLEGQRYTFFRPD